MRRLGGQRQSNKARGQPKHGDRSDVPISAIGTVRPKSLSMGLSRIDLNFRITLSHFPIAAWRFFNGLIAKALGTATSAFSPFTRNFTMPSFAVSSRNF